MEFITVEQFKEQSIEVQKVFLDWWKPSKYDLYTNDGFHTYLVGIEEKGLICPNVNSMVWHEKEKCIPLFTEGQLRKFIEDKTGCKNIELTSNMEGCQYGMECYKNISCLMYDRKYEKLGTDVFQAYWKVACIVAKEELNG